MCKGHFRLEAGIQKFKFLYGEWLPSLDVLKRTTEETKEKKNKPPINIPPSQETEHHNSAC
jgi:hypothetical protein